MRQYGILLVFLSLISPGVLAEDVWFYLGPDKHAFKPELKEALDLIKKQPECAKPTEASWGKAKKFMPGHNKGIALRVTCEVNDITWGYDNFWVMPNEIERSKVYRQETNEFLSSSEDKKDNANKNSEEHKNNISKHQEELTVGIIQEQGFTCDSVNSAVPFVMGHGLHVFCNNWQYAYDISINGTHLTVEPK